MVPIVWPGAVAQVLSPIPLHPTRRLTVVAVSWQVSLSGGGGGCLYTPDLRMSLRSSGGGGGGAGSMAWSSSSGAGGGGSLWAAGGGLDEAGRGAYLPDGLL